MSGNSFSFFGIAGFCRMEEQCIGIKAQLRRTVER
jgi:hypothetical protein